MTVEELKALKEKVKQLQANKIENKSEMEDHKLSDRTKQNISLTVGVPYEDIVASEPGEMEKRIESISGKPVGYPYNATVDGYPVKELPKQKKLVRKRK